MKLIHAGTDPLPGKLNFGCGSDIREDWVNLDVHIETSDIDLVKAHEKDCAIYEGELTSPSGLPLNYFEKIEADMVMEHIHPDVLPSVLYSLYCIAEAGCVLNIIVPDFDSLAKMWTNRTTYTNLSHLELLREITNQLLDPTMGSKFARGHQSLWTRDFVVRLLTAEGWDIEEMAPSGPNNIFLHIKAIKPENNEYSLPVSMLE